MSKALLKLLLMFPNCSPLHIPTHEIQAKSIVVSKEILERITSFLIISVPGKIYIDIIKDSTFR